MRKARGFAHRAADAPRHWSEGGLSEAGNKPYPRRIAGMAARFGNTFHHAYADSAAAFAEAEIKTGNGLQERAFGRLGQGGMNRCGGPTSLLLFRQGQISQFSEPGLGSAARTIVLAVLC